MTSKPTHTFSFEDGVLRIEIPRARMRLRWKPAPLAEELYVGRRRWEKLWPEFRLLRPRDGHPRPPARVVEVPLDAAAAELAAQKAEAFAAFRAEIEPEIVQVAERFGSHQWALMAFMHGDEWATDLAQGNPVLAYALANNHFFRGTPPEVAAVQARWHCHRKQRALLEWLGFPASEPFVRLLRQIPAESVYPLLLLRLGRAVQTDGRVLEYLSHLSVLNTAVLEMATTMRYVDLLTPKLLKEVSETGETAGDEPPGDMLMSAMMICESFNPNYPFKPFTSIQQIRRFRERADAEYLEHMQRVERRRREAKHAAAARERRRREEEAERRRQIATGSFPRPPIPGTTDIVPLVNSQELREEGASQSHCAGGYTGLVATHVYYVYKVLHPERATVAIMKGPDGSWSIREIRGRKNQEVQPATRAHVQAWLDRHRVSI